MSAVEVRLQPAMGSTPSPRWDGARWIGAVDESDLRAGDTRLLVLEGAADYATARLLVRRGRRPLGVVEVPITASCVDVGSVKAGIPPSEPAAETVEPALPAVTVAVVTRDRPENVAAVLSALTALDYPDYEILIVDNASADSRTRDAARALGDPRVRVVTEPRAGLSRGRNTALLEARYPIVAFTDDDTCADRYWLRGVAAGFAQADDVAIVCGMVPSGELLTPAQGYFEARIAWETTLVPRVFRLSEPPTDVPLFPFEVGSYGTGANFAVRRDAAIAIGGVNEALGAGSPCGGGEDIDLFVRMLFAGHALAYEPSSLVWHRHRRELADLEQQASNYGRGFGAWITAVFADPTMRSTALRRVAGALRRTRTVGSPVDGDSASRLPLDVAVLRRREVQAMVSGPWWYLRSRLGGRVARPLRAR